MRSLADVEVAIGELSCCCEDEFTEGVTDADADVLREEVLTFRSWRNGILKAGMDGVRKRLVSVKLGGVEGGVRASLVDFGDDTRDTRRSVAESPSW